MLKKFCTSFFLIVILTLNLSAQATLKEAFKKDFLIGAALNSNQFNERDKNGAELVKKQFNCISPENVLKWQSIHPTKDKYNFSDADKYVEFGLKNNMFIIGHTLVWHNQTPKWVFEDDKGNPVSRDELLNRMRDHIHTVVGRYKGKVRGWDVVNEALNEDGTLRQSPWMKIIGEDYLAKAFQFAHEADPDAELYYNDYSLENEAKRNGAINLVKKLQAQKIKVTGIGTQGHWNLEFPKIEQLETTIKEFAKLGKVMVTELDIDVLPSPNGFSGAEITANFELQEKLNPYKKGLPEEIQQQQANRYGEIFKVFLKFKKNISRITFWGVTDGDSWKNGFPVRGRTNYPLLFDREWKPKLAYNSVIQITEKN
ncbi:MAG: endo-1,4-beta-xylanase [Pyrinomonadaceae bacterium]|nr:endo-1,4-beta-xylanase [Pyrinomonadaceae bacterium]